MDWLPQWDSFVKVVEEGSMAGAARRLDCDCTRAQVSRQIGELEQAFGVRLFERSTRRLALTPSGEVFHRHAVNALAAIEGAEVAVRNAVDAPRGLLRVSATINFGRECVAPLIPGVLARYPELDVELVLSDSQVNMAERGIDLALRLLYGPTEEVVSRQLLVLQRIVCAAPAYLAARGRPLPGGTRPATGAGRSGGSPVFQLRAGRRQGLAPDRQQGRRALCAGQWPLPVQQYRLHS